jgi:hypothetical protein
MRSTWAPARGPLRARGRRTRRSQGCFASLRRKRSQPLGLDARGDHLVGARERPVERKQQIAVRKQEAERRNGAVAALGKAGALEQRRRDRQTFCVDRLRQH